MTNDYGVSTYGDRIADIYDQRFATLDPTDAVSMLAGVARGGRVLEFGIGTGRLALPLAERGIRIEGIDASETMVAKLCAKPGGAGIKVTMGDFANVAVEGRFSLVFVAFNTIFALLSQEEQVRCFANVSAHLDSDGVFVVEAFVPDVGRFDRCQTVRTFNVGVDHVELDTSKHDAKTQTVTSMHIVLTEQGTKLYPVRIRYAWPSELDLMARLAGLQLRERWSDWKGSVFGSESQKHVSVYARS
jgi:SAM-dependent methyltransferase